MRTLRTLALACVLGACMLAPTQADDDDIQVPNVLNAPPASAVVAYAEPVIAITHVRVVDGTGAAAREDQTVLIDHGKIRAFGASSATAVPNGAKVIDGSGETLTPGFVGTHDHLYFVSGGPLTLANFEGALPQPDAVAQRMFDLEDAETVADIKEVRGFLAKRPASEAAARKALFDKERAFEIAYFRAGGLLTQGPDPTGYGSTIAGLGDQRDMELLVEAGLTPLEAIRVATQNGAIALGRERSIGTIAIGKNADLVLIRGNPAIKIDDVENVVSVFKDGVGYDSAKLLASVRGKVGRQ